MSTQTLAPAPNPAADFALPRRRFLQLFAGGLLIALAHPISFAQESGRAGRGRNNLPTELSAWLHIDADGRVTVFTGKIECGQNIRTSLAQLVAEELRTPFASITMLMGDTDLVPWDAGTFGSQTTPQMGPQLRNMAAAARAALLDLAAKRFNAHPTALLASDGKVTNHNTGQSLTYGELTRGEKFVTTVSARLALTPAADWRIAGTPIPKVGAEDFVTGKHIYPSDVVLPNMLYGKVLRATGFNARLVSLDTSAAEKIPGVKIIRDGDLSAPNVLIAVVAPEAYTAEKALAAIQSRWDVPTQPSNENIFDYLKANAAAPRRPVEAAAPTLPANAITLEQTYTIQYIAHCPLEPRAAVAQWENGKLTVWTGTQRPFGVRDELCSQFSLPATQVRVLQPDMGSGYGGKHTGEAAVEAARLSKLAGQPVKVVWTREEEFTWAYLRPAGVIEMRAALNSDGALAAWEHHNYNSGNSGLYTYYDVPSKIEQFHEVDSPLRQGSYRGLASTANHFARESFIDELAHAAHLDPLAFRLKNLTNERVRNVLLAATEKFGWKDARSTPTRGFGLACGTEKGGYVATCVEADLTGNKVRIVRVTQAWESGAIVNPDGLNQQNSGSIVQAIGGALFEAILFANGRLLNPHFAQYRMPRFTDTPPQIDIVLLDRKDLPSAGAGETGIAGLAPAIGNAIFAATGQRLRHMPMAPPTDIPGQPATNLRA